MKLSDYFDKIFIIGGLNSPKVNHTIESFKKLGLYDENIMLHMYLPLDKINISIGVPNDINDLSPDRISLTLAHYTIVKQAYDAGLNNVLVLEDDNYFYDDISKWEEVLTTMPDDWDVMKFTGFRMYNSKDKPIVLYRHLMHNKIFRKIDINIENEPTCWAFSASAIAFNRNGMKVLIENQEKFMKMSDNAHGIYTFFTTPLTLNIYMPTIPLFVPIDDVEKKYKCGYYLKYDKKNYI